MFLTKKETAKYYGISIKTVERRIKKGEFIFSKLGGKVLILIPGVKKSKNGKIVNI